MKLDTLGPEGLESGMFRCCDAQGNLPERFFTILLKDIVGHMNCTYEADKDRGVIEAKPHYSYVLPRDLVTPSLADKIVAVFRNNGWQHTKVVDSTLVVAREPYPPFPSRSDPDSRKMVRSLPGRPFMNCDAGGL